ncbi:telomere length regulation protein [Sodiomyces alkalinus F11]|uniref:Telomere length regulation protein n=1 Tax=Sodiomyces alkalinus (strain CBS 110278 / VKM F-3762 / F11) TaxID=1314773 RepID=A0A3N2PRV6_SODAK|nr:telomere length regulation protein [Sodiomyces alkalinus F11]ROT37249.1 telomere length regulation protein [Sodiomyces alkalinus F11]
MEDLLTPVSQTYFKPRHQEDLSISKLSRDRELVRPARPANLTSIQDALELLKSQPDYDALILALKFLAEDDRISNPTPESAQVIQVLISDILLNYWPLLKDGDPEGLDLLLSCLRNITAVNALITRMKTLIQESKTTGKGAKRPDIALGLGIALQVLTSLLEGHESLRKLWSSTCVHLDSPMKQKAMAHELVTLFSGGKLVSVTAEGLAMARESGAEKEDRWVADGRRYSVWLGSNVAAWISGNPSTNQDKLCYDIFVRALRLGYSEHLIKQLIERLLLSSGHGADSFMRLVGNISQLEQKRILYAVLKYLAETFLNKLGSTDSPESRRVISGAAAVIEKLVGSEESRKNHLIVWLTGSTGAGLGDAIGIRRAVLAVLARDKDSIGTVLEKSLNQFGDQLYIRHSPVLQQEAHAQVLLLSAGYVYRSSPLRLRMLMRSGSYLHTISNRLDASQSRAKFLGMAIGEALSALSDSSQNKLDFQMEEMDTREAIWYKSLTNTSDDIGTIEDLGRTPTPEPEDAGAHTSKATGPKAPPSAAPPKRAAAKKAAPPRTTGFIIEEIEDSDESDEDDIIPYPKPSSDPEDSDDDPTLIRRDKPKAPVYIRDLISYFRDSENYDKQKLALATAPSLIRRKASFGTEVSSHADELASLLVGLQDKFDMEGFSQLRIQGMIALVVAQPDIMAPWFAKTFFDGDYSIAQRASILVVLGLSARELAGFETSEYASAAAFPSKRLPERLEKLYIGSSGDTSGENRLLSSPSSSYTGSELKALPATALDTIAQDLAASFLAPLAAGAADAATGPDALKLSTFTSRLAAVGNTKVVSSPTATKAKAKTKAETKTRPRIRSIPNKTAALIASGFFAPLTARFQHVLRTPAQRRHAVLFNPHLLPLYLKTLALLVHAAGPATLSLPQMTAELWDLLLGVRGHVAGDLTSTHALLVALAALLEVNDASGGGLRRLCEEMPREFVETQEWVGAVFNGTRGEDRGEENDVKMLAAGVLVTLREAMEKYRALLMGDLIG